MIWILTEQGPDDKYRFIFDTEEEANVHKKNLEEYWKSWVEGPSKVHPRTFDVKRYKLDE